MMRIGRKLISNGIRRNYVGREVIAAMKFTTRVNINNKLEDDRIILNKRRRIVQVEKDRMINDITMDRIDTAEHVVSWFMNQMPPSYFKQVLLLYYYYIVIICSNFSLILSLLCIIIIIIIAVRFLRQ